MNKLPLVLVTWNDANTGNEDVVTPENVEAYHKPTVVYTLGWLLRDDVKGVTIVNEYYDEFYRGRTFIYRPMIISVTPFNLSKPRVVKKVSHATSPPASDSSGADG